MKASLLSRPKGKRAFAQAPGGFQLTLTKRSWHSCANVIPFFAFCRMYLRDLRGTQLISNMYRLTGGIRSVSAWRA
jgi:hypothetical protein